MNLRTQSIRHAGHALLVLAICLAGVPIISLLSSLNAATFVWDGGDADNAWSSGQNWNPDGSPPQFTATADLVFSNASVRPNPNMDQFYFIRTITFDAGGGAFTLTGSAGQSLGMLGGGIVNNASVDQSINIGSIFLVVNQTWDASAGNLTFGGNTLNLGGNTLTTAGSANTSIANVISGTSGLTKSGSGTVTLSGANTYSGGTIINAGTISISADGNLGATSGGLTFGGGTLRTTAGITSGRNVPLNAGGGTFDNNGFNSTLSGVISGVGAFTKTGAGTLALSGNNTYSGTTTINSGTLRADSATALGSTVSIVLNGGTLQLGANLSFASPPSVTLAGGALDANNRTATFGALTLSANSTFNLVNDSTAASLTFGSGSRSAGALTISGWANTLTRDSIFFTTTPSSAFLDAVQFAGFAAGSQIVNGELAPAGVTPVPEPEEYATIFGLALLGFALYRGRGLKPAKILLAPRRSGQMGDR